MSSTDGTKMKPKLGSSLEAWGVWWDSVCRPETFTVNDWTNESWKLTVQIDPSTSTSSTPPTRIHCATVSIVNGTEQPTDA